MKRLIFLLAIVFLLLTSPVFGQNWVTTNQATVGWDAVVYSTDQGERLVYRTYLVNSKTDPGKVNPALIGDTEELQYTFTLTQKGSYFVGVRSVVQVLEGSAWSDVSQSEIGWSDDPTYVAGGETFGIRYYPPPGVPGGMKPVTQ